MIFFNSCNQYNHHYDSDAFGSGLGKIRKIGVLGPSANSSGTAVNTTGTSHVAGLAWQQPVEKTKALVPARF